DDPARGDRGEGIPGDGEDLEPAPDDEQVQEQEDADAEEAALLGERGEDEVRSVLREEVPARLRRGGDSAAPHAAGADGLDRLREVVRRVARIALRMRPVDEPRFLVRLE